jgi:hypothetical protein
MLMQGLMMRFLLTRPRSFSIQGPSLALAWGRSNRTDAARLEVDTVGVSLKDSREKLLSILLTPVFSYCEVPGAGIWQFALHCPLRQHLLQEVLIHYFEDGIDYCCPLLDALAAG